MGHSFPIKRSAVPHVSQRSFYRGRGRPVRGLAAVRDTKPALCLSSKGSKCVGVIVSLGVRIAKPFCFIAFPLIVYSVFRFECLLYFTYERLQKSSKKGFT